jgi:polyhydroxybutyrate depolymerase
VIRVRPARSICLVGTLILGALSSSCSGGGGRGATASTEPPAASACTGQGTRPHSFTFVLESGGRKRNAIVHVPPHPGRAKLPLLLVFHFAGGPARAMEESTGLSGLADKKRFVAVYPNAAPPNHFWNISSASSRADDVSFVRDLLDNLGSQVCFDPSRVYATGVSNGGGMAARVGCDLSDRIAAVAPVSGGYSTLPHCTSALRASLLEIHGTGDPVVPYTGHGPSHAGDVMTFVRQWAAANGCGSTPARSKPAHDAVRFDWPGCRSGTHVAHVRLRGFGHGWPGAPGPVFRGKDSNFPANSVIWRFLSSQRLARQPG